LAITVDGKATDLLTNETGGHRIQRIPRSEHSGRVHSSTVTVAVLDEHAVAISRYSQRADGDFSVQWYSGSGAGGQHRNKTQNSARVTHVPSGLVRQAQTRSRENSLQVALAALHGELDRLAGLDVGSAVNGLRRAHMGSGERSDKRRTLRFQEGRVHDHITGKSAALERVMKGGFRLLW